MKFNMKTKQTLLMDYSALEKQILSNTKKSTVDKLPTPLAETLIFLKNVAALENVESDQKAANILYGALLAAKKYVELHQSYLSLSKTPEKFFVECVDSLLLEVPSKNSKSKPVSPDDNKQIIFSSALNVYLDVLFEANNSSSGLKSEGPFAIKYPVLLTMISDIIIGSYKLENKLAKTIHSDMHQHKLGDKFILRKITTSQLPYDFQNLKDAFRDLLLQETGDKGRVDINHLDSQRSRDLNLLGATIQYLEDLTTGEHEDKQKSKKSHKKHPELTDVEQIIAQNKEKVVAGMFLLMREQIAKTYSGYAKPFSLALPVSRMQIMNAQPSLVAKQLTQILHLKNEIKAEKTSTKLPSESSPSVNIVLSPSTEIKEEQVEEQNSVVASDITPSADTTSTALLDTAALSSITQNSEPLNASGKLLNTNLNAEVKESKEESELLMSHEAALELINAAYYFLHNALFIQSDAKTRFNTEHIFKDIKDIKDLDIFALLNLAQELKQDARVSILTRCVNQRVLELENQRKATSEPDKTAVEGYTVADLLGRFGAMLWSTPTPPSSETSNTQTSTASCSSTPSPLSMNPSPDSP